MDYQNKGSMISCNETVWRCLGFIDFKLAGSTKNKYRVALHILLIHTRFLSCEFIVVASEFVKGVQ